MDHQYEECFKGAGYRMDSLFSPKFKLPALKRREESDINSTFISSIKQNIRVI